MKIQFKDYTADDINLMCDTNITDEMTFSEVVDELDRTENNYFYISLSDKDVIEAVNNEIEIAEQLGLWFAHIMPQGICVALYQ